MRTVSGNNATITSTFLSPSDIKLPNMNITERVPTANPKRVYANAHAYHINSIAVNSDGETFMSADDLRINLWSLGLSDQSYSTFIQSFTTYYYANLTF